MNYLILGASAAGINAAKTLRKLSPSSQITVVSADKHIYSRCMLHYYISGKRSFDELNFVDDNFFKKYNIRWLKGVHATDIDTYDKRVFLSNTTSEHYDKLLIATGSSPSIPQIKNIDRSNNVFSLHSIEEADAIKERLKTARSPIILGGGLIGVDIATELLALEKDVTIIEYGNNLLALQLDRRASKPYEDIILNAGVRLEVATIAREVILDDHNNFRGLILNNGEEVYGDMLIISAGVKPNLDFLKESELLMNRGVVAVKGKLLREGVLVNKYGETNIDDIYAAGDVCAEKMDIWPLAVKQGIVAAYNMAGHNIEIKSLFGLKYSMNFFGINTISIGDPNIRDEGFIHDVYESEDCYKRIIHKDGIIYSAILQGDVRQAGVYEMLIKHEIDISHLNKNVLDISYADFFDINRSADLFYDFSNLKEIVEEEDKNGSLVLGSLIKNKL